MANHGLEFIFGLNTIVPTKTQKFDMKEQLTNSHSTFKLKIDISAISALAELDYLIELDFPDYSGTRLDSNVRSKLGEVTITKLIGKKHAFKKYDYFVLNTSLEITFFTRVLIYLLPGVCI